MITCLIVIKIRFVHFQEAEVDRSRVRLYAKSRVRSPDYRFCNPSVIFGQIFLS